MTRDTNKPCDALILAAHESTVGVGQELIQLVESCGTNVKGWLRSVVNAPGEALRLIHRHSPTSLLVCVDCIRLDEATGLIEVLRHHCPQIPLLTVAAEHDDDVERAVRIAGARYYFALASAGDDEDERRLISSLEALSLIPHTHSGLPPPRSPVRGR